MTTQDLQDQAQKLTKLPPRKLQRHGYRGYTIEEESCGMFAVRYYQTDPDTMHDFKPWCDSLEGAMKVADKLIERAEVTSSLLANDEG